MLRGRWSRLGLAGVLAASAAFAACGSDGTNSSSSGGTGTSGGGTSSGGASGSFPVTPNDGGNGNTDPSLATAVAFDPLVQEVVVDGVTPKAVTYMLKATMPNGEVRNVTPESLQFDRPDLGSAQNGAPVTLTASGAYGGTGKLHGIYGGKEAIAELRVKLVRRDIGQNVPAEAVTALDGANLATDPTVTKLRYPYDKTVFPLGLVSPLVMWNVAGAGDVYKLHLEQSNYTYDLFAVVNAPGQLRVDQAIWDRITASNTGDPLTVTLSRWASGPKTAFKSSSISLTIAPASLRGAIYYWTASQLTPGGERKGHIARIRPGAGSAPEVISTGQADPCMGCHAVSADGSTLAASVELAPSGNPATYAYTNGWNTGRAWASFDLPAGTVRKQTTMAGNNLALTPDGKYTVFGGRFQTNTQATNNQWGAGSKYMTLADTKTGDIIANSGLDDIQLASSTVSISMPAFAPDGTKMTAVEFNADAASFRDNVLPDSTGILIFGFDQPTLKFTAQPTRLPLSPFTPYQKSGIGYPSFTPDSKAVAFHVGNHSTGCFDSCLDDVAHRGALYFQNADGVGTPIRMAALNDAPETIDREVSVEPTFNPVQRGNYSWVVFTSMRDWGNKLTGAAINGKRRLWVAAIDGATGTADPSHPAFYLEGQEDTPNMRGFWTLAACTATPAPGASGGTCEANFECCSGFCDKGVCVEPSTLSCVGVGGDCSASAGCCNPSSVSCIDSKCRTSGVK